MLERLKLKLYIYILGKIYIDMRKNTVYHTGKQTSQVLGIMNCMEKTINEIE